MVYEEYFLIELELPDGNIIRIAGNGRNLRIRGVPFQPIEIENLYYNRLGDKTQTVHRTKLIKDV